MSEELTRINAMILILKMAKEKYPGGTKADNLFEDLFGKIDSENSNGKIEFTEIDEAVEAAEEAEGLAPARLETLLNSFATPEKIAFGRAVNFGFLTKEKFLEVVDPSIISKLDRDGNEKISSEEFGLAIADLEKQEQEILNPSKEEIVVAEKEPAKTKKPPQFAEGDALKIIEAFREREAALLEAWNGEKPSAGQIPRAGAAEEPGVNCR